jgi:hypothetical protein
MSPLLIEPLRPSSDQCRGAPEVGDETLEHGLAVLAAAGAQDGRRLDGDEAPMAAGEGQKGASLAREHDGPPGEGARRGDAERHQQPWGNDLQLPVEPPAALLDLVAVRLLV